MKIFPTRSFTVEIDDDTIKAMAGLKQNTDITDTLISEKTEKAFRGQVSNNGFRVISSEIGRGALCVLTGEFDGKNGTIEVNLHSAFKVMFSILFVMPLIAFGIVISTGGIENAIGLILPILVGIIFIRYAFLELGFRFVSKTGLNKLTKIIGIIKLKQGTTPAIFNT